MKKRVWMMNHYAGAMYFGIGGSRHYCFAKYLRRKGYEPVVFCCNAKHNSNCERYFDTEALWEEHLAEEIETPFIFVKGRAYTGNGKQRVLNMVDFYRNVQKAAKEYAKLHGKPDVILASSVHPLTLVAGIRLAKYFGVKCICEVRDLWPEAIFNFGKAKENSPLGKCLIKGEHWIYRHADALIFTKEGDTDHLKECGWTTAQGGDIDLAKCHYINNGVDIAAFDERIRTDILADADLDSGGFLVTYAGTVRPVNNVGNILDAAKLLSARKGYEDVRFLIYGDGMELPRLRERVRAEGISNVKLKGAVDRKYIPYVLSKSSVNILNYSQNQYNWSRGNSSNKLFEYMASGRPIISTVKMGYSIIDRYRCGAELSESTAETLAEQVMRFHDMDAAEYNRFGCNAREGAKNFDFKALTDKLETVIEGVT